MRFTWSPLRALTIASSIVLLSLVSIAPADASPRRASGPICDAQMPALRKLPRHPRSFGGPLKRPSDHALAGLQDMSARVRRGTHGLPGDTAAAIQNDAPIAGFDAGDRLIPSLRPLEIIRPFDLHPHSRAFSPRSPRGPPLPA